MDLDKDTRYEIVDLLTSVNETLAEGGYIDKVMISEVIREKQFLSEDEANKFLNQFVTFKPLDHRNKEEYVKIVNSNRYNQSTFIYFRELKNLLLSIVNVLNSGNSTSQSKDDNVSERIESLEATLSSIKNELEVD